ncbi:MAG: hypothetical protein M1819_006266 [Sarea resinae]|nr:MAG: hypothetical protein M1819_006266 [Sarea resinae]
MAMEVPAAIPKFASFKPKAQAPLKNENVTDGPEKPGREEERQRSGNAEKHRHRHTHDNDAHGHRHHERKRSRDHHRHRGHRRSRSRDRKSRDARKSNVTDTEVVPWDEGPDVYVIDTRGDPNNLTYGTVHRYSIPAYLRSGAGGVMGLPKGRKIDRAHSSEKSIVVNSAVGLSSIKRERYAFARNERKQIKKLRIRPEFMDDASFGPAQDFVSLRPLQGKKRKRARSLGLSSESSSEMEESSHYRSIEGKAKAKDRPVDRDLEYGSESSASDYDLGRDLKMDENTRRQGIELSRMVEAQPNNAEAWLAFVEHQDKLLGNGEGPERRKTTQAERRSTADIKLSIYEKALASLGRMDEGREALLLGMMEEGSQLWDSKKIAAKWRNVLQENPSYLNLWTKYLDFQQTNFVTFRYEDCRNVFMDCLALLKSANSRARRGAQTVAHLDRIVIYVLLRLTLFTRESGFPEQAIAIWQGLLELNYFMPDRYTSIPEILNGSSDDAAALAAFETFWESEVPRIGEDGAESWSVYFSKGGSAPEAKTDHSRSALNGSNLLDEWARQERELSLRSREPARTIDEVEEDDPYRVILFSDIRDTLVYFADETSRSSLIEAFLLFCRLPPMSFEVNEWVMDWWNDSFTRNEVLEQCDTFASQWFSDKYSQQKSLPWLEGIESEYEHYDNSKETLRFPMHHFIPCTEALFGTDGNSFATFQSWDEMFPNDSGPVRLGWLKRALEGLVTVQPQLYRLAEYLLAFEATNFPHNARKLAKRLLKKHPSSLRLYNAYALLEIRAGNSSQANNVFCTAVNMSKTLSETNQQDTLLLWRTWIRQLLEAGEEVKAFRLLLSIAEDEVKVPGDTNERDTFIPHPTAVLKAKQTLYSHRDHAITHNHTSNIDHATALLSLLTYLSSSSLPAVLEIYSTTISLLHTTTSLTHELLMQSLSLLLIHHRKSHPLPPSLLPDSLDLYPTNTIIQTAKSLIKPIDITARLRSLTSTVTTINPTSKRTRTVSPDAATSLIPTLLELYTSLRKTAITGTTPYALRASFERAVTSPSLAHSAALWTLYVLFEAHLSHTPQHSHHHQQQRQQNERMKQIFHRGLQHLPWCKPYIFLAFSNHPRLKHVFNNSERKHLWNVLLEKELRVRWDIGEELEEAEAEAEAIAESEARVRGRRGARGAASGHGDSSDDDDHDGEEVLKLPEDRSSSSGDDEGR